MLVDANGFEFTVRFYFHYSFNNQVLIFNVKCYVIRVAQNLRNGLTYTVYRRYREFDALARAVFALLQLFIFLTRTNFNLAEKTIS